MWRTKLQYHAWDFNRNFLSFSIRSCCSIVVLFFFFQTFVNEMRISQQPVDLKLKDNIRFGYDILEKNAVNLELLFLLIAR